MASVTQVVATPVMVVSVPVVGMQVPVVPVMAPMFQVVVLTVMMQMVFAVMVQNTAPMHLAPVMVQVL